MSTRRVDSRISGPRIRIPSCAPRPVPTSRAVGVASPSAHGHATIRTATAAANAVVASSSASHTTSVTSARPITSGTNTAEMRSASRCTGALPDWASLTSRAIWASAVSLPTRVARTTSLPPMLTVAPATSSPGPTSTGTLSPVRSERSTVELPSTTTPSVASFSPGRTTKRVPTVSSSTGRVVSLPSSASTVASFAPSASSARRAAPARCLARVSTYRPASTNVVTTAATSR